MVRDWCWVYNFRCGALIAWPGVGEAPIGNKWPAKVWTRESLIKGLFTEQVTQKRKTEDGDTCRK